MSSYVVPFLRFLGKVKFTMVLLLGGIVAMAIGTIVESSDGADAAFSSVYGTVWFDVFLVLIAVNLIGAVINRIPIKRHQWAFVVTHASIVLLLIGALISREVGYEGTISIQEKSESKWLDLRTADLTVEWADQRQVVPLGRVPEVGRIALDSPDSPELRITRVAHDSEFRVSLKAGTDEDGPGVEVHFRGKGWDRHEWLVGEHRFFRRKDIGAVEAEVMVARDQQTLKEWLTAQSKTATILTLVSADGSDVVRFQLPEQLGKPRKLGAMDVTVKSFFERARVKGDVVDNDPQAAINPAAVVEIRGHGRQESHTVFSRFPQFNTTKRDGGKPLTKSVALQAEGVGDKPLVRILVDPATDRHWVQLAAAAQRGEAHPLQLGKPAVLGSLGIDITLEAARKHARPEIELRRARKTGTGSRFIEVESDIGGVVSKGWIQFGSRQVVGNKDQQVALTYRPTRIELPFTIALEDFEIRYHGGSRMASQYTSHIELKDPNGTVRKTTIAMNSPLDHAGFRLFQSSYQLGDKGQPDITTLSVSYDPGANLVYIAFALLILGVTWYLRTNSPLRDGQQPQGANPSAPQGSGHHSGRPPADAGGPGSRGALAGSNALLALVVVAVQALGQPLAAQAPPNPAANRSPASADAGPPAVPVEVTRGWAIQAGGRIKPLETRARELIVSITGKRAIDGYGPLDLLWGYHFTPAKLRGRAWIRVDSRDLKAALGFDSEQRRFSFDEILGNRKFQVLVEDARKAAGQPDAEEQTSQVAKDALEVYTKLEWIAGLMEGTALTLFPTRTGNWASAKDMQSDGSAASKRILAGLQHLSSAYQAGDAKAFAEHARSLGTMIRQSSGETYPSTSALERELFYYDLNAYGWAWIVYLVSMFPLVLFHRRSNRLLARSGITLLTVGFLLHTTGILLRWAIAGRAPVSDMYESLVFMSWGVVCIGLLLELFHGGKFFSLAAAMMGAISLMFAEFLPLDSAINPLVPVLAHTAWLTIHVMTIMLSYSAFALSMALGHIVIVVQLFQPGKTERLRYLSGLLYRTIQVGLVFLTAGIAFGAIWANESWGRYWGWDPKETWSLITFFVYLAIVHARFAGWLHNFGLAVCSIVGFLSVLMTYYGVNFILASGLHSYGFSSGGTLWLIAYLVAETLIVLWALTRYRAAVAAGRIPRIGQQELAQPGAASS